MKPAWTTSARCSNVLRNGRSTLTSCCITGERALNCSANFFGSFSKTAFIASPRLCMAMTSGSTIAKISDRAAGRAKAKFSNVANGARIVAIPTSTNDRTPTRAIINATSAARAGRNSITSANRAANPWTTLAQAMPSLAAAVAVSVAAPASFSRLLTPNSSTANPRLAIAPTSERIAEVNRVM